MEADAARPDADSNADVTPATKRIRKQAQPVQSIARAAKSVEGAVAPAGDHKAAGGRDNTALTESSCNAAVLAGVLADLDEVRLRRALCSFQRWNF